ncbi:glutathione S-transferase family protein [Bdellovibrio svalbardensis]|uniref:Glutathione S-transferase family protein n=1 Tax=Bdellovibrio svalbardensis TaxID=2972972 RepID=A0ABT6DM96_9BACT|nr:glutathione S-transferase family protein [Bdellovibrio svalbardensis]MDG0816258.1 glutathione S-transferase family protein [Bdellovibrio svalbardensis]
MMIEVYGSPRSSAGRVYLMLEELGLKYKTMPMDMKNKEHKSPEFLALNPNGKVPCLKENDYVIWESIAINQYLAEKYMPEMLGSTPEEKGHVAQWSVWAMTELQPPLVDILIQMIFVTEDKRNHSVIEKAKEKIPGLMNILNQALTNKDYLVGGKFSVADINMASVVSILTHLHMDVSPYKNVQHWMEKMNSRPAFRKYSEL